MRIKTTDRKRMQELTMACWWGKHTYWREIARELRNKEIAARKMLASTNEAHFWQEAEEAGKLAAVADDAMMME